MPLVEISVEVPKQIINVDKVIQSIKDAQRRKTTPKLIRLFGKTVGGWKHRPQFYSRRVDSSTQLGVFVHPGGQNADTWALVNEGAGPHIIRPRKAKILRFQRGYRAGTKPRTLSSRAYQRSGQIVTARIVHHPGFEAREFTQTIADEHEPEFRSDMQQAILDGRK